MRSGTVHSIRPDFSSAATKNGGSETSTAMNLVATFFTETSLSGEDANRLGSAADGSDASNAKSVVAEVKEVSSMKESSRAGIPADGPFVMTTMVSSLAGETVPTDLRTTNRSA